MAKRRKRKSKKPTGPQHTLPEGFWRQAFGVLAAVAAILLVLAMFGIGGPLPHGFLTSAKWLVGMIAFLLPVILVYYTIELFRAELNQLPRSMKIAGFVFVASVAAFIHLFSQQPTAPDFASAGNGGGMIGFGIDKLLLAMLDTTASAIVLGVIATIACLYVLKITFKTIFSAIGNLFTRDGFDHANQAVMEKMKELKPERRATSDVAELKLNQGVPVEEHGRGSRSLRNSMDANKAEENAAPLTTASDPDWKAPSLELLEKKQQPADAGDVKGNAQTIKDTLAEFNIDVEMEGANIGPKVTQYTLKPPAGVKLTRITALETNIALNLAAQAIRIEAPIPGQRAVGIEVPNKRAADVRLYGVLESHNWKSSNSPLSFAIGKDIAGDPIVGELDKMPHLLIAGQTGSGKSVMINTLLSSLLYRNSPATMKLILVDPKQVELTPYNNIPHLLTPVITEPEKCISALKWAVNEMERRYSLLAEVGQRNIAGYNASKKEENMPYVVIVIDELADLMMLAARDVEALIVRLAQKARAVGIHLVLATQRPSVDVITGLIKANIPARIAFTVASQVDSRTILDQMGAEKLLGQGDMLMLTPAMSKPKRIQGAFVSDEEVVKIADHIRMQRPPDYDEEIIAQPVQIGSKGGMVMDYDGGGDDDMYRDAVRCVVESGKASASLLQRRLRVGYARAARLIETMEEQGVIGPADGARPRDVLVASVDDVFNRGE
ncbi:MAG TPA: DNA translocase FtsK 4TM domain-containing protein [Candidatus Saccharimonadales bacterium]|nr:DNA translocase FtsK 4TM domain-containing protein [Candidatus Saccharimonadales bacterium]